MSNSPIPRTRLYRALEILPGALTWSAFILPILLSFWLPAVVAYFIIIFDLYWLFKSINTSKNLIIGYRRMQWAEGQDWQKRLGLLSDLEQLAKYVQRQAGRFPNAIAREEVAEVAGLIEHPELMRDPKQIVHLVMLPTYKESYEVLEATVESLVSNHYSADRIMLAVGLEDRDQEQGLDNARRLERKFGSRFYHFQTTVHPSGIPGEVKGKGPNITYAGRVAREYLEKQGVEPDNVIVTSLDADHRPHPSYFSYLTYKYCMTPHPETKSFQPMQLSSNNVWDVPFINRIIAFGNSFWLLVESVRGRRFRNYSTHAQSLQALIDTDFWSVATIVEDGHQFWRTYFAYNGDHQVVPLFLPVYVDAVLSQTYKRTMKAQYIQLRRWAWGASDVPFVITNYLKHPEIGLWEKMIQTLRLIEGHFSWATASVYLLVVAWLPSFLNHSFRNQVLAHNLAPTASRILTLAMVGLVITIWVSMLLLPPRPPHRKKIRTLVMAAQWLALPVVTIFFSSLPVIEAQTRLMFGSYLEVFDVTEKVRKHKVPSEVKV
jgi:hypothetical protein